MEGIGLYTDKYRMQWIAYSGTLLASSTLISNDIIKPFFMPNISEQQFLKVSRIITFLIGTLTIIFALWIQDVLVALDVAYAVLSGAVFFPIVLGFFWKRATAKAAFYSIISSTVVVLAGLAIEGITSTNPILYGMVTSFIIIIVVSLLDFSNQKQVSTDEDTEEKKFALGGGSHGLRTWVPLFRKMMLLLDEFPPKKGT